MGERKVRYYKRDRRVISSALVDEITGVGEEIGTGEPVTVTWDDDLCEWIQEDVDSTGGSDVEIYPVLPGTGGVRLMEVASAYPEGYTAVVEQLEADGSLGEIHTSVPKEGSVGSDVRTVKVLLDGSWYEVDPSAFNFVYSERAAQQKHYEPWQFGGADSILSFAFPDPDVTATMKYLLGASLSLGVINGNGVRVKFSNQRWQPKRLTRAQRKQQNK